MIAFPCKCKKTLENKQVTRSRIPELKNQVTGYDVIKPN